MFTLDILASFLYDGRKWRCVVYLYVQSAEERQKITVLYDAGQLRYESKYCSFTTKLLKSSTSLSLLFDELRPWTEERPQSGSLSWPLSSGRLCLVWCHINVWCFSKACFLTAVALLSKHCSYKWRQKQKFLIIYSSRFLVIYCFMFVSLKQNKTFDSDFLSHLTFDTKSFDHSF